ncbi:MAG: DUF2085 domain-containing protein [Anaerolineales bacterium]|nr:MAG: DUF2085 domain-containing protein [Anaerolineales bacterium]
MNTHSKTNVFQWISVHWFETFLIVYGLWVFVPFLAPVFMQLGWTGAGRAVYFIYSFFCHQLPERSFFWFGGQTMYSLGEIQAAWQNTSNPMILRQFIGNEAMGWKVAWSDRMISFYTSVWFFALLWYPFRRGIKPISWWFFSLLLLPIAVDGITHAVSDLAGIGQGFRDTNAWLATLTNSSLPAAFYAGDALGSFNSIMRFVTGLLAGLGIVWLVFPYVFQTQALERELEKLDYGKVIEQIKNKNPTPSGG